MEKGKAKMEKRKGKSGQDCSLGLLTCRIVVILAYKQWGTVACSSWRG